MKSAQELHTKSNEEKLSAMADKMDNRLDNTFRLIEEKLINFQRQNCRKMQGKAGKNRVNHSNHSKTASRQVLRNSIMCKKRNSTTWAKARTNRINQMTLNLNKMRETIESKLDSIREDNNKKLEQMRETGD